MKGKTKKIRLPEIAFLQDADSLQDPDHSGRIENIRLAETVLEDSLETSLLECELDHVSFSGKGKNLQFTDIRFENCDLSNAVLDESAFRRCLFRRCRMLGTTFIRSRFEDVTMEECVLDYANFSGSSWQNASMKRCRFNEAAFTMCTLKNWLPENCSFCRAELMDTNLEGIDLSACDISGIMLKASDLKGVLVNRDQAAVLAGLLGIIVKE